MIRIRDEAKRFYFRWVFDELLGYVHIMVVLRLA
jgi:hypothetical protein